MASRFIDLDSPRLMTETAIRGGLAVALYAAFPAFSDVYRLWLREAGALPGFPDVFEYQPVAALWLEPFYLAPNVTTAVVLNGMTMTLAGVLTTYLLNESARRAAVPARDIRLWVASPALLILFPVNMDVAVVALAVASTVGLYQGREAFSGVLSGVGTAFKLVPGFLVLPVLPLIRGNARRLRFLVGGFTGLVLPYLIYRMVDDDWLYHLEFASERSDVGATIWGLAQRVGEWVGVPVELSFINVASTVTLLLSLVGVAVWAARSKPSFAQASALAIVAALLFLKVFKPQYVLWLIPFLAWTGAERRRVRLLEAAVLVEFAAIYFALPEDLLIPMATTVRVILLLALGWGLIRLRVDTGHDLAIARDSSATSRTLKSDVRSSEDIRDT